MVCNAKPAEIPYEKVFDRQRQRVRDIWLHSYTYHAQMDVLGKTKRIPLPTANSIATAWGAQQELKTKLRRAELTQIKRHRGAKLGGGQKGR